MLFTDDKFPLLEGSYYKLADGRIVGPVTPVVSPIPNEWLRVMVWGDANYEVPGYRHDEETPVVEIIAKYEPEVIPEPPMPDHTKFLVELSELSRKHGFYIGGCGCCGSPWVTDGGAEGGSYVASADGSDLEWR